LSVWRFVFLRYVDVMNEGALETRFRITWIVDVRVSTRFIVRVSTRYIVRGC